ncbi:MAG: TRAP transporter substrate-binding protein DctP [Proteobacteria bacterium]|nr:TRAP transporter substrate-binding protein DctP [Pseudomonadota bacterium]
MVTIATLALSIASPRAADLDAWSIHGVDHPSVRAMERLGEVFVEKTGGAHRFARTHRTDRTEAFLVQEVRLGKVGMAAVDIATFHDLVPETRALSLPYLFSSDDQVARALNGPVGGRILGQIARLGLVALCFYDGGDRSFISRKPILRPSDLFGLRVATHPSGLEQGILRALGAKPIVLPEDKIARALKTGLIDAADADFTGFRESQKRDVGADWSATNHARSVQVVVMSRSLWGELSAHDRAALYAAAQESVAFQRKVEALLSTESPGTQAGASVDRRAFVETLRAVAESYRTAPTVEPLVNQIRETGSRDR